LPLEVLGELGVEGVEEENPAGGKPRVIEVGAVEVEMEEP
jgi:hypothetical protein